MVIDSNQELQKPIYFEVCSRSLGLSEDRKQYISTGFPEKVEGFFIVHGCTAPREFGSIDRSRVPNVVIPIFLLMRYILLDF